MTIKTKKNKLSSKKRTKYNSISKTRINKIQKSQHAGSVKISNIIVIEQYYKTFETEDSIDSYNPEDDFNIFLPSNKSLEKSASANLRPLVSILTFPNLSNSV